MVILTRGKCGLSKCITRYLVNMAAVDLLVVITDPLLRWIGRIYFSESFLRITPVCSFAVALLSAGTSSSVWLTVAFTFDRFVAICCENLKAKYCTERTAAVVIASVCLLGCLVSAPWYFIYKPLYYIGNIPWGCLPKPSFYTSRAWAAFDMIDRILTPFVPFFLIMVLNVLTVRSIVAASRVRKRLLVRSNGENEKDPETENRRKSIVLLFSISGCFVLLWTTKVFFNVYRRVANIQVFYSYSDPNYITQQAAFMLQVLSSCTNTCIYVLTQRRFREQLLNATKYPLHTVVKFVQRQQEPNAVKY
ncbi:G-protein coupled receptor 15-like [Mobula birostris]|uniref:G-protein coupled receptor 15-like n=1 Tax=Mobula birostris TaxID=1983395 RepID=UPI003B283C6D